MIVRALDTNGDWTFGKGRNDYKSSTAAISQNIQTRLLSFLGDCFFDNSAGIDWFNLLGGKNQTTLALNISAVILNTDGVLNLLQLSLNLDVNRNLTIVYSVNTVSGIVQNVVTQTTTPTTPDYLLTEDGDNLTTEDGDRFII